MTLGSDFPRASPAQPGLRYLDHHQPCLAVENTILQLRTDGPSSNRPSEQYRYAISVADLKTDPPNT